MEELARRWRFRFWSGICRAHYAGVLTWRGKWNEAEAEIEDATRDLQASRPPYVAEGIVRLAELRRRQGRLDEAAELFAQTEGHPLALLGSAEIALERGESKEAEDLLQRYLRQTPEENQTLRAPAFELLVRTYVALGDDVQATAALKTLQSIATAVATQALLASAAFAAGAVAVAAADYQMASHHFQDAVALFRRGRAPYEAGRARIELANVLYALGRLNTAQNEARAAMDSLRSVGAHREAERAEALLQQFTRAKRGSAQAARSSPLTPREIEVIRLVAQGLSDKEIAARLNISEHTIHRHIANILTKLDVPSRAAAVAFAAKNSLL